MPSENTSEKPASNTVHYEEHNGILYEVVYLDEPLFPEEDFEPCEEAESLTEEDEKILDRVWAEVHAEFREREAQAKAREEADRADGE